MWRRQVNADEVEDVLINQTKFGEEKPLFDDPEGAVSSQTPAAIRIERSPFSGKPTLFFVLGILCLSVGLLVSSMLMSTKTQSPTQQATPSPSTAVQRDGAFSLKLSELEADFVAADPAQDTLPFPPIQTNLGIDPIKQ